MGFSKLFGALALVAMASGCGGTQPIQSSRTGESVVIDGNDAEWRAHIKYFEDEKIAVGVKHDDENLYVCVGTADRNLSQQLMRHGFTLWLDAEGGTNQTFGIHFPVSPKFGNMMQPFGQKPQQFGQRPEGGAQNDGGNQSQMDKPLRRNLFDKRQEELEFFTCADGEKDTLLIGFKDLQGIKLSVGESDGAYVYELQVPLQKSAEHPYAIGSDGTTPVGIGIITDELPERSSGMGAPPNGRMGGPGGGGNMGGRGGMGGPPGGRMGGGGKPGGRPMQQTSAEIELWLAAELK